MTNVRRDGLYLSVLRERHFRDILLLRHGISAAQPTFDFRFNYETSIRCLMQDVYPYKQSEFLRVTQQDGHSFGSGSLRDQATMEMTRYIYPPTSFVLAPFGTLPWGPIASLLWTTHYLRGLLPWGVSDVEGGC